ncbi:putative disease resistance RPP13-like protein 1 [Vitis riparia]|uniref:putative disease resistance RPP13-like protein 1 n=1 Tax=Vitis riparia TaxID=96939 RepID=UPI00155A475D|nr:putative disease resistance RPP13-like protein 1 [Vitis riparia]
MDSLRSPLLEGAPGSKILVTTRNLNVATMMGGDKKLYELKHLSDDDCWLVFQKHAFENRNVNEHPDLALIGREIVKKCGGLPLAAKALGGLLRSEHTEDKWNIILDSKIWNLPGDKCGILPALRLSYNHLPSHLKRCFAYCALFPQDYEFKKEELILLWMAEGLIQQSNEDKKMEDLGGDYFCELLSRSFFQSSNSNKSRFVMHDLINDLAKSIAGDTCLHLDDESARLYHAWAVAIAQTVEDRRNGWSKKMGAEFYGETRVSAGLKCLPDGMMLKMRNDSTDSNNLCLLEELEIYRCPSLICFPKGQLPTP